MIGAGGDMRVFWSNGLVGSITTLALILLFWPLIGRRSGFVGKTCAGRDLSARHTGSHERSIDHDRATDRSRPSCSTGPRSSTRSRRRCGGQLGEAIAALSADDAIRCIIVRGAGEKAFSPGNDIGEFATERANKAQAIEYGARHARDRRGARAMPPSAGRADPRHLRRRRARDRGAVRPAHLRRVEPLRRADQEPRARDGVPGDGAARAPRRPRASRSRSCSRDASSTRTKRWTRASSRASCPTTRWRPKRAQPRERIAEGAPLVARWHKKFARRLADPRPLTAGRARRVLRLLRHRGLPHRLRGVPREAQARVRGR